MIERKNIIKILGERVNVYHSAVITCYNFDPIFFESVYLPTLRRLGITNVVVLTDASMYDQLLSDASYSCHQVKMNGYQLVRKENHYGGVFHSKVIMLFGMDEAALIVGSGNITFSGMSNNEEVWNAFHAKGESSPNFAILKRGWEYVKSLISSSSSLVQLQMEWIEEQCDWINSETDDDEILMESGETAMLLYNDSEDTIMNRLVETIGDAEVEEITVVAPFYDTRGDAIKCLKDVFDPEEFHCVMDLSRQSAPYELIKKNEGVEFYSYTDKQSPLHAKIIEIHASNDTWLLSGSANIGNMALGTNKRSFNDEACILVHSDERKEYIRELGLEEKFEPLFNDDLKKIVPPKRDDTPSSNRQVTLMSCENKEEKLHLTISTEGITCTLQVKDSDLEVVQEVELVTAHTMEIDIESESDAHLVVLTQDEETISNYCLVVSEVNVESCNPDPKRRKLSSLLDDSGLMDNISHILGFIEFDDGSKTVNLRVSAKEKRKKTDDESESINREQYDDLKDGSRLNLSMHSGVRILSFLQGILFKTETDEEASEDDLFDLQKENEGNDDVQSVLVDQESKEQSEAEEAKKLRNDVFSYLVKMTDYLYAKAEDESIQEEGSKSMPVNGGGHLPKLIGKAGLNESSSFAVAATIVSFLMQNHGKSVIKVNEVRDKFYECACMFFVVYGQHFTHEQDTNKKRKVHDMLKDATTMLYVSLCYFSFRNEEYELILTVLNSFDVWKKEPDTLDEIIISFREKLAILESEAIDNKTYAVINHLYEIYKVGTPIRELSRYDEEIYLYRQGYGFIYAYDVAMETESWKFTYFHPRYANITYSLRGMTKYKGYKQSELV